MGWKIPEIKIRVPKVRVPKIPAGRAMSKVRVRKPVGEKMGWFSLTVFSSGKHARKGITHIDVIKALIETNGNRSEAARKLGIHNSSVGKHAKNIRNLSDAKLAEYAEKLGVSVERIKQLCANMDAKKGVTDIDVLRALFKSGGNQTGAGARVGIAPANISKYVQKIRSLPAEKLQEYAAILNTTAERIMLLCADSTPQKGITHIDVITALIESNGNKTEAAKKLNISKSGVSTHASNIRRLPAAKLAEYAKTLNLTVDKIRAICVELNRSKGITHIDVIKTLIKTNGNRTEAAAQLKTSSPIISFHVEKIRNLPRAKLAQYAKKLNTTIDEILKLCADLESRKGITHIDVLKALFETGGVRKDAALILGIVPSGITEHIKNIRRLPASKLAEYAREISFELQEKITVSYIAEVLSPRGRGRINFKRRLQVIEALIEFDGCRVSAAKKIKLSGSMVSYHAKNIQNLSDAELAVYAEKSNTAVNKIRQVCSNRDPRKGIKYIDVIRVLLKTNGNKTAAAKMLGIDGGIVGFHCEKIRRLPQFELTKLAAELNTGVEEIRRVCAPGLKQAKEKIFKK